MAIQAMVPMMVARTEEKNAKSSVFFSASIMASFLNMETYHFKVNPPHFALVLELLKDKTISVRIGAYKKIKIIVV